jgi:hypothetical protein
MKGLGKGGMQAKDRKKLTEKYVRSLGFVRLWFLFFLVFILTETLYDGYRGKFSSFNFMFELYLSISFPVFCLLIPVWLVNKKHYKISFLVMLILSIIEFVTALNLESRDKAGKPLFFEFLFDFLVLLHLWPSKWKDEGCIWHLKTDKGIFLTYISEKKRLNDIYQTIWLFHSLVMIIYSFIFLIVSSFYVIMGNSSSDVIFNEPLLGYLQNIVILIMPLFLKVLKDKIKLSEVFALQISDKDLDENSKKLPEIDVSLKCSFDKCTLWVKNKSERKLYEIHIPLDLLPDELRKVIAKENENPKIPILEPGKESTLAEINRELLATYLKKNELDFDYAKILYKDVYNRWYSLYIELHKDYVIPIVPDYKKLSLLDAFKMF